MRAACVFVACLSMGGFAAGQPANDNFAAAISLSNDSGSVTGDTTGATREFDEPWHAGTGGASVWYAWLAPASGTVTFDTHGSSFDTVLAIYTGPALDALSYVVSNDDAGGGLTSEAGFYAEAAWTYLIAVDGYGGAVGAYVLNWAMLIDPPANDLFANAIRLDGALGTRTDSNAGATREPDEPWHAGTGGASVWYVWTAPAPGTVRLDTFGSAFDTVLAVYTGTSLASLSLVIANDDAGGTLASEVEFTAVSGTDYYIAVDGYAGAAGSFELNGSFTAFDNDEFINAIAISGGAGSVAGTNQDATAEPNEPAHANLPATASVWYRWTAPWGGPFAFSTEGSGFDTVLAVYVGATLETLAEVASNDDAPDAAGSGWSEVTITAVEGTEYYIAVDGFGGASGSIALDWLYDAPDSAPVRDLANDPSEADLYAIYNAQFGTAYASSADLLHVQLAGSVEFGEWDPVQIGDSILVVWERDDLTPGNLFEVVAREGSGLVRVGSYDPGCATGDPLVCCTANATYPNPGWRVSSGCHHHAVDVADDAALPIPFWVGDPFTDPWEFFTGLYAILPGTGGSATYTEPDLNPNGQDRVILYWYPEIPVDEWGQNDIYPEWWLLCFDLDDGLGDQDYNDLVIRAPANFIIVPNIVHPPPTADAGPDQIGYVGSTVFLDGSGTESGEAGCPIESYAWSLEQRPVGSLASLGAASVFTTFVPDRVGEYIIRLDAVESGCPPEYEPEMTSEDSDWMRLVVVNRPPVAQASAPATAPPAQSIPLDGTASYDLDNQSLAYSWVLTGMPAGAAPNRSSAKTSTTTFTADLAGAYTWRLLVDDGHGGRAYDDVIVMVGLDEVWVDFSAPPGGDGSSGAPFQTLANGVGAAGVGATIHVAPGQSSEVMRLTKAARLVADGGGAARIGVAAGKAVRFGASGGAPVSQDDEADAVESSERGGLWRHVLEAWVARLRRMQTDQAEAAVATAARSMPFALDDEPAEAGPGDALAVRWPGVAVPEALRYRVEGVEGGYTVDWLAPDGGGLWLRVQPVGAWPLGATLDLELTNGIETVSQTFAIAEPPLLTRLRVPADGLRSPVDPGDAAEVAYVSPCDAVPPMAGEPDCPYLIGPPAVFDAPRMAWLPLPPGLAPEDARVYYYQPGGPDTGWHPAETVPGWIAPGPPQTVTHEGAAYLGLRVHHGAVVQVGR